MILTDNLDMFIPNQGIKQCSTILKPPIIIVTLSWTVKTEAKQVPFLSLDVWTKLYYLRSWEESGHKGNAQTFSGWAKSSPPFASPAHKQKFHKEIRIKSDNI